MIQICKEGISLFSDGNCFANWTILYTLCAVILLIFLFALRWLFHVKEEKR
jgi:hypothetical protein